MANSFVSIQIIPKTRAGEDLFLMLTKQSKSLLNPALKYEVHPLETTMEGDLNSILQFITSNE